LALFILSYYLVKSHSFAPKLSIHLLISSFGLLVFFLWIVLYPRTVIVNPTDANFPTGEKMRFYSIGRVARMVEPGKFTLPEGSRDYIFDFTCWRKIDKLQIDFGSLDGVFYVELYWFDKKLFQGIQQMELQTLSLSPPPCYRLRNTNLYRVHIYLKKISGTLSHTIPYHFSVRPI
ncbi:MAG: hypothetical protein U9O50_03160, partial [Acidobacteriota bacterium]|nr:hypothetical protein [Acidobacteriota bacterium]